MFEIIVLSKRLAKQYSSDIPWAAIQVDTYANEWPKLNLCQQIAKLQLHFSDVPSKYQFMGDEAKLQRHFDDSDVEKIYDFIEQYKDKFKILLIHCEAGISRSPAIAAAIHKSYCGNNFKYFVEYTPHLPIYCKILDCLKLKRHKDDENCIR